jgi:hypothetical protein
METLHPRISILALLIAAPLLSFQQNASTNSVKRSPPSNVPPTVGQVLDGTYKNPSLGIELAPPQQLHLGEPEMKGTPGQVPLLVLIKATEDGFFSGLFSPKSLLYFYADALAYYPADKRSVDDYVKRVIRANEKDGYKTVVAGVPYHFEGIPCERVDFVKDEVHESVLITTNDAYAFVFIFAGSDFEVVNKLIVATKVKLAS